MEAKFCSHRLIRGKRGKNKVLDPSYGKGRKETILLRKTERGRKKEAATLGGRPFLEFLKGGEGGPLNCMFKGRKEGAVHDSMRRGSGEGGEGYPGTASTTST